jgi:hypothetical protein
MSVNASSTPEIKLLVDGTTTPFSARNTQQTRRRQEKKVRMQIQFPIIG